MQEQMRNIRTEMDVLRKNQKNKLEIKNTVTELKNAISESFIILNSKEFNVLEKNIILVTEGQGGFLIQLAVHQKLYQKEKSRVTGI